MTDTSRQWQDIKANYLKQIEKSLADIDHPQRQEILANVSDHLDNKYAELPSAQQTWEGYQQIITEMGPPEEYAELLAEEKPSVGNSTAGIHALLAVVFVIVLMIVGGYLIYNAQNAPEVPTPSTSSTIPVLPAFEFEPDERVLGKWITIDFVKTIDDFDPTRKNWSGGLYLQSLEFKDDGNLERQAENRDPITKEWTKGKVDPLNKRPSFYYLRNIDGQTYLFYEWISGDVTARGREPSYYVLKHVQHGETAVPSWFQEDPQAMGYWESVDLVKKIETFDPGQPQTTDLFIKTLRFENNGRLWWTVGESRPIALDWTKGKIRPFDLMPAAYEIRQIKNNDYLFYEHKTLRDTSAGYYIFKRTEQPEQFRETGKAPFENDPRVLGRWESVDFVESIEHFQPDHTAFPAKLYVKGLDFKEQGIVEWCLGEDHMSINHRWTKGQLPDDDLNARYIIKTLNNSDYLFMEWNSGDVTIRGQRPAYYVLKKAE